MGSNGLFTSGYSGGTPLPTAQERADRIVAEARRSAARPLFRPPPPQPMALQPTDDLIAARLAEETAYARRILDAVGDALAGDSVVAMRHAHAMQQFDIVGQMLGHIAGVLAARDRDGAIDQIGMANLKARLQR